MITTSQIQAYNMLLARLQSFQTRIFHFIAYRRNKIHGIDFNSILNKPTFLPHGINCEKIVIENDQCKYTNYKNNVHHWTTSYCWNHVIPQMLEKLNVRFNPIEFDKIPYIWNTSDFSYHRKCNGRFQIIDMVGNSCIGNHDVLRVVNDCPIPTISLYHSLFRLSHKSGTIKMLDGAPQLLRVVINCDSMAIPIVPILACYCKEMLVIDNRTGINMDFASRIAKFKPTHYLALFTEENFLINAKHVVNLQ